MKTSHLLTALLFLGLSASAWSAGLGTSPYRLDSTHSISFTGPTTWVSRENHPPGFPAVNLEFKLADSGAFFAKVSVFMTPKKVAPAEAPARTRSAIATAKAAAEPNASAPIVIQEIKGRDLVTYYFDAIDKRWKAPAEDDYKHLLQGVAGNGEMMVVFTFLYNEDHIPERQQFLDFISSARLTE